MKTKSYRREKVNLITLGCSKNLVDSENMITQLSANGYAVSHDQGIDSEIAIINTCGFIDLAKEESVNTILDYVELKKEGRVEKIYVTGCLSERYREDLKKEIPEVDAYFGTLELPRLLDTLNADYMHDLVGQRSTTTPAHYAYLKISEGCNRTCSFCAIPLMRGKHISKSIEELVEEAKGLAKRGVVELILIAQELTYYGLDLYKKRALSDLIQALSQVEGIQWIRLHYAYPSKFPVEVLDVMNSEPKVCKYLDLPLQHASDGVLGRMRRQITRKETQELVDQIRAKVPDITLRTTFLVGFPGETQEEFDELLQFVEHNRFDRVGVFKYSHEEDTIAHKELADDVDEETKEQRASLLMELQRGISEEKNAQRVGKTFRVLIDRIEGEHFVGRTEGDSPEVDNEVLIPSKDHYLRLGDFVEVQISDASEYDLIGEPVL